MVFYTIVKNRKAEFLLVIG